MGGDFIMFRKCPVCGREFTIPDVDMWVFKRGRGNKVLCSWGCLREYDRRKKAKTREYKRSDR